MAESKELKKIKKKYGEEFMHLCREIFPTILENEGELFEILTGVFSDNCKTLYEDITSEEAEQEFEQFIMDIYIQKSELTTKEEITTDKNPYELDEYGTSVMSIQFEKNRICTCSIKNRYNHTVNNPDATYGNDLDRIIPGLSYSFKKLLKERGLEFEKGNIQLFDLNNYQGANNGKYYKYNLEKEGIYFCPGNIIIKNSNVKKLEHPESQLLINYYIVDLKNKTISLADQSLKDSFPEVIGEIEDIKVAKKENGRKTLIIKQKLYDNPIEITIDKNNRIIKYKDNNTKTLPDDFMNKNTVETLEMNSLEEAGDNFFKISPELKNVSLPNLKKIGNQGFMGTKILEYVEFPNLEEVGDSFLFLSNLKEAKFPKLKRLGKDCLEISESLELLYLPKIKQVGNEFLELNQFLKRLKLPQLEMFNDGLFMSTKRLEKLDSQMIASIDKDSNLCEGEIAEAKSTLKILNQQEKVK